MGFKGSGKSRRRSRDPKRRDERIFHPSRLPSPMCCPKDRSHDRSPSTNQFHGPRRGFVTRTNKRILQRIIQQNDSNKHSPKPTQPQRVSSQWARAIRSSTPVRGPTLPSIPPSLHRFEEVYPKTESQRSWISTDDYYNQHGIVSFCQQPHLVSYPCQWGNVNVHED